MSTTPTTVSKPTPTPSPGAAGPAASPSPTGGPPPIGEGTTRSERIRSALHGLIRAIFVASLSGPDPADWSAKTWEPVDLAMRLLVAALDLQA